MSIENEQSSTGIGGGIDTINYGPRPESVGINTDEVREALHKTSSIDTAREFVLRYLNGVREHTQAEPSGDEEAYLDLIKGLTKRHLIDHIYTLGPVTRKPHHPSFRSVYFLTDAMEELLPTRRRFYYEPLSNVPGQGNEIQRISKQNQRYLEIVGLLPLRIPEENGVKTA